MQHRNAIVVRHHEGHSFWIGLVALALLLGGCNSTPPKRDPEFAATPPVVMPPAQQSNGAIFQSGYDQRWFEDIRARRIGDILVVNLVEQTGAKLSNSTDISKSTSSSMTNPTLFGGTPNFRPKGEQGIATLDFGLSSSHTFAGSGDNAQSNQLSGAISVSVVEVLPNGYLRIRGEKRLGMNSGNEYVKLSGIVRPADIDTRNTVDSTKIADATLVYVGDGQVANTNVMGWLAKFFISSLMPF